MTVPEKSKKEKEKKKIHENKKGGSHFINPIFLQFILQAESWKIKAGYENIIHGVNGWDHLVLKRVV